MTMVQPHSLPRAVAENLFVVDGEWFDTPFRRRMTVVRLRSGDLVVHSAIHMSEGGYAALDKLGHVSFVVVPNAFHSSDAHYFAERYPAAKVLATREAAKAVKRPGRLDGLLPDDWPAAAAAELECIALDGTRLLGECLFVHKASGTLIATDAVFNMQDDVRGGQKLFFKWNKIYKSFGPSRIFKLVFLKDPARVAASIDAVLARDFDRVVMSHGEILETGGKEALRRSFAFAQR